MNVITNTYFLGNAYNISSIIFVQTGHWVYSIAFYEWVELSYLF